MVVSELWMLVRDVWRPESELTLDVRVCMLEDSEPIPLWIPLTVAVRLLNEFWMD